MRRRVLSYGLIALAATAAAGGYAFSRLLDRPGETSLALVPADALGAMSLDLVPAPDQIVAFKSIDDLIAKAPTQGKSPIQPGDLLGSAFRAFAGAPELDPLSKQVGRSLAFAMLPKPGGKGTEDGEAVALLPVKDPQAVAAFLGSKGKPGADGVVTVATKGMGEVKLALVGSVLVASDEADAVASVVRVGRGEAKSIVDDPSFAAARATALPSANLIVLVSPKVSRGADWAQASMTIRDTGIEVGMTGQTDDPDILKAGSLVPLDARVLAALPRGAYGFLAAAQPGPAVALAGPVLDEPSKEAKKEMDLDLKEDVLPALGGNLVFGFYPSYGPDAGLDLLVSLDDANGANPAELARKLEKSLGDQIDKGDPQMAGKWKVSTERDGVEIDTLSDEAARGFESAARDVEKSFFRPLTLSKGKTFAWTKVGRSVLFATSQSLLGRAVAARKAPSVVNGLAGDPALGAKSAETANGQVAMAISMRRLSEGLRNTIDPSHMSPEEAKTYRKALSLYDNVTEPLALRASMGPDGRYNGYISVPFDWSKLPDMLK